MIVELWVLLGCVALIFVLIFVQQVHIDRLMGVKFAISNRGEPKTPTAFGGRADRALENAKENTLMYAPLALIVAIVGISSNLTEMGALVFGLGRVVHAFTYLAGIIFVRSLAWMAGIIGLGMMVFSIVSGLM